MLNATAVIYGMLPIDITEFPEALISCGNRTDLFRKNRRHIWVDMGDDVTNKGTEGIVQVPVRVCARCGKDDR